MREERAGRALVDAVDAGPAGPAGPAGSADAVLRVLRSRSVVRQYTGRQVDDEVLEMLVSAMLAAPTASNKQAWAFVAVRERRTLRLLGAFAPGIIGTPPLVVAACFDRSRPVDERGPGEGGWDMGLLCVAMAVENLLLAAHALGLGGCPVGGFREGPVRTVLRLPAHLDPVLLVPVGHPAGPLRPTDRRDRNEVLRHDTWEQ